MEELSLYEGQRAALDNEIYSLLKGIWGKKKTKGYHWIAAKFDYTHKLTLLQLGQVVECLRSKKLLATCPIHNRVHDGA